MRVARRVLISLLNWNGGEDTLSCIRSIKQSRYADYDILVTDNASSDGSADRVEVLFPDVLLRRNQTNLGFAGGHNQAIKFAQQQGYELLWILNNDTKLDPEALAALVSAMDRDSSVGMVSPVIIDDDDSGRIQFCGCSVDYGAFRFEHFNQVEEALQSQAGQPQAFCLWGTAILARTTLLARLGGFDDVLFAYYEDLDLSIRVVREGFVNRIVPAAVIRHGGINDPDCRPPHYVYFNTRNRFLFWRKHVRSRDFIRLVRTHLAGALVYASTWREKGNVDKESAALLAIWDGLVGRGGAWDPSRRVPTFLSNLLLRFPYLIADLLRGDVLKRLGRKAG